MAPLPDEIRQQLLWTTPIGLAAAGIATFVLRRQRAAFRDAPPRPIAFTWIDAAVAIALFVLGPSLLELVMRGVGLLDDAGQVTRDTSLAKASIVMLRQIGGQGPLAAYVIWCALRQRGGVRTIGLLPARAVRSMGVGVMAIAVTLPIVLAVITITVAIGSTLGVPPPPVGHPMLTEMRNADSNLALALFLTSAILIAPLIEEIIFRGLVQTALLNAMGREARWVIVLLAAGVFTLVHANVEWQALPGLFVLGAAMGWTYERTGSLWASIVMHVCFNLVNSVAALLMTETTTQGFIYTG